MKRLILILILILLVVYGILSVFACGSENDAERLFYRAMMIQRKIVLNPEVVPPVMLTSFEDGLKKVVERYPTSKTAKTAQMTLAQFYLNNKKYPQAVSALNEIINKYKEDRAISSNAQFLKGTAYERQNQWERALREYTLLRDKYSDTPLGVQMPLYIGKHYLQDEKFTQADKALQEAVLFYEKLRAEHNEELLGYIATNLLVQAYLGLKDYEQAGAIVEDTINAYPYLQTVTQQLPNVELIFVKKLNSPKRALAIYHNVKAQTEDQRLIKLLDEKIKTMEKE